MDPLLHVSISRKTDARGMRGDSFDI